MTEPSGSASVPSLRLPVRSRDFATWASPALLAGCSWVIGDLPKAVDDRPVSPGGASGSAGADAGDGGLAGTPAGGGLVGNSAQGGASAGEAGDASTAGGQGGAQNVGGESGSSAGREPDPSAGEGGVSASGASGTSGAADGGAGACKSCDCDGDGALSADCSGEDCNDHDENVKPGQTDFFLEASPGHGFDYDCSTEIEYEARIELTCDPLACDEVTQAFIGTPACGTENAAWGRCVARSLADCRATVLSYEPVRCH